MANDDRNARNRISDGISKGLGNRRRNRNTDGAAGGGGRAPHPRIELTVNELTGTMSWRTLQPRGAADRPGGTGRGVPRTAGAGPAGLRSARSHGAAPIPTHPAVVRAAVSVSVESLTPEQARSHLAAVGALRSRVAADLAVGAHLPTAVAARTRSGSTPAAAHALTTERADAARELIRGAPAPGAPPAAAAHGARPASPVRSVTAAARAVSPATAASPPRAGAAAPAAAPASARPVPGAAPPRR
ncbi:MULTISPECIES: hypothetical protein [unclassified Streptomyces]|uniref:hypothetical protein n=1 Tax=unclassified Streptomyces TaxID=2593676 RepID=UPI002251385E|nr:MULTISPECIES: hypothetical protein [unclassified Streptomyces]MCX4989155.1 hypothetical protein [Streptomyces sp. NBC_00568]MCX5005624.1 hypothetical protein [Streptomyces sp. NBC_00638]